MWFLEVFGIHRKLSAQNLFHLDLSTVKSLLPSQKKIKIIQ